MTTENINQLKKFARDFDDTCTELDFLYHTFKVIEEVIDTHDDHFGSALLLPMQLFDELRGKFSKESDDIFEFLRQNNQSTGGTKEELYASSN